MDQGRYTTAWLHSCAAPVRQSRGNGFWERCAAWMRNITRMLGSTAVLLLYAKAKQRILRGVCNKDYRHHAAAGLCSDALLEDQSRGEDFGEGRQNGLGTSRGSWAPRPCCSCAPKQRKRIWGVVCMDFRHHSAAGLYSDAAVVRQSWAPQPCCCCAPTWEQKESILGCEQWTRDTTRLRGTAAMLLLCASMGKKGEYFGMQTMDQGQHAAEGHRGHAAAVHQNKKTKTIF
eukprot:scaffold20839_cov15-Tisochrysis_lutea.AAC.1